MHCSGENADSADNGGAEDCLTQHWKKRYWHHPLTSDGQWRPLLKVCVLCIRRGRWICRTRKWRTWAHQRLHITTLFEVIGTSRVTSQRWSWVEFSSRHQRRNAVTLQIVYSCNMLRWSFLLGLSVCSYLFFGITTHCLARLRCWMK